jgi:hypothetical protein
VLRTATTTLAAVFLLVIPASASAQDDRLVAQAEIPDTITLGEPTPIELALTNNSDGPFLDTTLAAIIQVPGGADLEAYSGDIRVESPRNGLAGASAEFEILAGALSASVPADGFRFEAGDEFVSTVTVTITGGTVGEGHQLEFIAAGRDLSDDTPGGEVFDSFTLIAADEAPEDEAPEDEEVEQPDRIDSGSGGLLEDGAGLLPVTILAVGSGLLLLACASPKARRRG